MTVLSDRKRIVIIGAGMAGCKLAQSLIENDRSDLNITLIGEEPEAGYNRIMLSPLLAKEVTSTQISFVNVEALCEKGLSFIADDAAVDVKYDQHKVTLGSGKEIYFDELVFATGSRASQLPQFSSDIENVFSFRNLNDVSLLERIPCGDHVCVVGGGLLGLEAAVGLVKRGLKVTLVHRATHILNRQLDTDAAALLKSHLETLGVQFELGSAPIELSSKEQGKQRLVSGVLLENSKHLACDYVVVATGITPEVGLAKQSGLAVKKAIVVNAYLQTSQAHVYAVGECSEVNNETFGLVAPIWKQLEVLVAMLIHKDHDSATHLPQFQLEPSPTKLKVSGVNLYSVGDINLATEQNSIVFIDGNKKEYRKLIIENDVIVAAILFGNVADGPWYFKLIQNRANVKSLLSDLIFGEAYCTTESAVLSAA